MDWLTIMDWMGTLVFALSGAFKAVKYELDMLGVIVLAASTGVGGGILRDTMLGIHPPMAFQQEEYVLVTIIAGLVVFFTVRKLVWGWDSIMVMDALGLGVFTAIGCMKAELAGLGMIGIVFMGVLTACGGGVIRDILVREIPAVIHSDFYATAAIIGGGVYLICSRAGISQETNAVLTFATVSALRLLAIRMHFELPSVASMKRSPSEIMSLKRRIAERRARRRKK